MRRTITVAALLVLAAACGEATDGGASGTTSSPDRATTSVPPTGAGLEPCESPVGFTIARPASWVTNPGEVVPACTQFNPEPFVVPPATDRRVAAITAYVESVPFATAAQSRARDEQRERRTVAGRDAWRISYRVADGPLYPSGTPVTVYVVDVTSREGGPATLFVDTVGVPTFDYLRNVEVLDRMIGTLRLKPSGVSLDR